MRVFLMRHAHAVADKDDARRRLSAQGHEVTQKLAEFFRGKPAFGSVHAVWHSPLLRARETAELLVQGLGLDVLLVETTGLQPEDDPTVVAERLEHLEQAVLIVGHEPQLGALATLLVRDKVKPVAFNLKKGAILALESAGGSHKKSGRTRWCVGWHFTPELLAGDAAAAD